MTGYHKTLWLVCTLAWFCDGFEHYSPPVLLPFQFQEFHLTAMTSGLIISSAGLGLLIGSYLFGYLSDRFGRRLIFQVDILIYALAGGARIFATGWVDLFIITMIANTGVAGMYTVDNAYMAEFLPPKNRGKWQGGMVFSLIFGSMLDAALMLAVPLVPTVAGFPFGWRLIALVGALPAFLIFWVRRTLPESVRFLLSKGRVEEAARIVEKLESSAGPNYHYEGPAIAPQLTRVGKANPKLFFIRPYIFYTIPLWLGWLGYYFIITAQGFLPTMFMMGLGGGVTGLVATVIVLELVNVSRLISRVFSLLTFDVKWIGRRGNQLVGCILSAVGMGALAYPWAHRSEVPLLLVAVPAMISLWSDCWYLSFTVSSAELFPIEARSMSYGWAAAIGRIAAIISPIIMVGLLSNIELFFYFVAALWVIILIATWKWIPETAGKRIEVSSKETVFKTADETE